MHWGDVYRQALAKGGVERPGITYDQNVMITAKRNAGVPLDDIYAEFDLTVSTFALVSGYWAGELTKDLQLGPGSRTRSRPRWRRARLGLNPDLIDRE